MGRPRTRTRYRYRCHCRDCSHRWVSQVDAGTPEMCPRPTCHSMQISMVPIPAVDYLPGGKPQAAGNVAKQ
jgi:hypothetical protein